MKSISAPTTTGTLLVALGAGAIGGMLVFGSVTSQAPAQPPTVELHPVSADETAAPGPTSVPADPAAPAPVESAAPRTIIKTVEVPVPSNDQSAEQSADRAASEADRARDEADRAEKVATKVETAPAPTKPAPAPVCEAAETRSSPNTDNRDGSQTQIHYSCVGGKWVESGRTEIPPPVKAPAAEPAPAHPANGGSDSPFTKGEAAGLLPKG